TILALRSFPCCPGAKLRFSTGHLSLKHLVPFRKSFMPSRRHRRHTASLYRANLFSLFRCRLVYADGPASSQSKIVLVSSYGVSGPDCATIKVYPSGSSILNSPLGKYSG